MPHFIAQRRGRVMSPQTALFVLTSLVLPLAAHAQTPAASPAPSASEQHAAEPAAPAASPTAAAATGAGSSAPSSLSFYFDSGSAAIRPQDEKLLDEASRLYRDGHPIVMIVAGSSDTVGPPALNLVLSQQRAAVVERELVARGIPAERFELLAKGESDLPVPTAANVPDPRNRCAVLSWK